MDPHTSLVALHLESLRKGVLPHGDINKANVYHLVEIAKIQRDKLRWRKWTLTGAMRFSQTNS